MLPCEYGAKYKIPSIKANLARNLKTKGVTNKEIAKILGVTEAAVSQYLSGKRAKSKIKRKPSIQKNKEICTYCKLCKFEDE